MNVRALGQTWLLVLGVVGAVLLAMAWFGDMFAPVPLGVGVVVGAAVAVVAARVDGVSEAFDDVPPPLFALVGVGLAWGGADYAPELSLSAFAGVAAGYAVAAAGLAVVDG